MYKARPHRDYCDVIYHIPPKQDQIGLVLNSLMETVEKFQYQAALAVTGALQGSSRAKLYEEFVAWRFSPSAGRFLEFPLLSIVECFPPYFFPLFPKYDLSLEHVNF